jgi:MAC/Perforin domain
LLPNLNYRTNMKRTSIFILLFSLLCTSAMLAQNTLRMASGKRLNKEEKIEQLGGTLIFQSNGNLVLYAGGLAKWQTQTAGKTTTHAIMQTDGNLVIYNNTTPVWTSDTWNMGANNGYLEIDLSTFKVAIYKADGTAVKVLQAGTTPDTVPMFFENKGTKTVTIRRATSTAVGEKVTDITNQGRVTINVKLGDQFVVEIDGRTDLHPKIFISDLSKSGIVVHGNLPLGEFQNYNLNFDLPDYYPNVIGIDLKVLNPRDLVNTISKGRIFELLHPINGVDYYTIGQKIVKNGFLYYGLSTAEGSQNVQMAYGFDKFSQGYSINAGASFPLPKGASGSIGVGYNSFNNTERSSTSVYAYTTERKKTFGVSVDPTEARLDPVFKLDALAVTNSAQALAFIQKYGTHYPKMVEYGGDRSLYMVLKKDDYSKVKGYGVDVKAKVKMSQQKMQSTTQNYNAAGNATTSSNKYGDEQVGSGSLSFSYEQNEEVRSSLENSLSKYRQIGGEGGFEGWTVEEANAAPINVDMGLISDLIDIKVFKDGSSPTVLAQKKTLIEQAITDYLKDMPNYGTAKPSPIVYEVELKSFEVTRAANEDANKGLKGHSNVVFKHNGVDKVLNMWQQDNYVDPWSTLCFCTGKEYSVPGGKKVYFTHFPEENGVFNPLTIDVHANFWEMDDNLADNTDYLYGHHGPFAMPVLADGASTELNFTVYQDGKTDWNSIRVKYKITRVRSEFAEIIGGL